VQVPFVSVVIVNWNQGHLLPDCLDALLAQDHTRMDVTVIDNGSRDGSPQWITTRYPEVNLMAFPENRGFCSAVNWGVRHTTGDYVLSLNPDVVARNGFVLELARAVTEDASVGMAAPKLLQAGNPGALDSTGLLLNRCRRPYDRGQGEPDEGQYDGAAGPTPARSFVFGACGAAAMYRRAMLDDVAPDGEYLDEDFFAYCDDADLAWRAQLRGWQCAYAPMAVATHGRGWGDTLRKRGHAAKDSRGPRMALRNRYLMAVKNDALKYLLVDLPVILAAEVPRLAYAAVTRPGVLLGLVDLIKALPSALRKRRRIRSRRTVGDARIRRWFVAPAEMSSGWEGQP
jgi:GT2 family glycosyltransferase